MENSFATLGEAAILSGVTYGELYYMVKNKRLASTKIKGVTCVHMAHVKNLMEFKNKNLVTKWT
jgi:hypothetical protein